MCPVVGARLFRYTCSSCRYYASQVLVWRLARQGGSYQRALRTLLQQAQSSGSAGLVCNPFVQVESMIRLRLIHIPTAASE